MVDYDILAATKDSYSNVLNQQDVTHSKETLGLALVFTIFAVSLRNKNAIITMVMAYLCGRLLP